MDSRVPFTERNLVWAHRFCNPITGCPLVRDGDLLTDKEGVCYPITQGIPDFLSGDSSNLDPYTRANIGYYEKEDRIRYELMWSQYVDLFSYNRIRYIFETYANVPLKDGVVYLDIGCGFGYFVLNLLMAKEIVEHHAIDIHLNGLMNVLRCATHLKKAVQVSRASAYELPYSSNTFDLITGNGVLHHLATPGRLSEQLINKLAPGGYGIFIEPTEMWERSYCLNPFALRTWKALLRRFLGISDAEVTVTRLYEAGDNKEPDGVSIADWLEAFKERGLQVRTARFHFLTGFFRSWIVSELMSKPTFWPMASLLYLGVRICERLDRIFFNHTERGFYHLIAVQKPLTQGKNILREMFPE